jgi:hypothetical protein
MTAVTHHKTVLSLLKYVTVWLLNSLPSSFTHFSNCFISFAKSSPANTLVSAYTIPNIRRLALDDFFSISSSKSSANERPRIPSGAI